MAKKILFLTGKLAEEQLKKILKSFSNKDFNFEVRQIGISVAALMTSRLIQRRVPNKLGAKKILIFIFSLLNFSRPSFNFLYCSS